MRNTYTFYVGQSDTDSVMHLMRRAQILSFNLSTVTGFWGGMNEGNTTVVTVDFHDDTIARLLGALLASYFSQESVLTTRAAREFDFDKHGSTLSIATARQMRTGDQAYSVRPDGTAYTYEPVEVPGRVDTRDVLTAWLMTPGGASWPLS